MSMRVHSWHLFLIHQYLGCPFMSLFQLKMMLTSTYTNCTAPASNGTRRAMILPKSGFMKPMSGLLVPMAKRAQFWTLGRVNKGWMPGIFFLFFAAFGVGGMGGRWWWLR